MIITIDKMLPGETRVRQSDPNLFGNDPQSFRTDYTERKPGVPQMLLVEQPLVGSTVLAHYHSQDQFQLFVDGNGTMGRHAVSALTLHYSNRYTGYGPIVAGQGGLSYYVLRPSFDTLGSGQYLIRPELRDKLKTHPGPKLSIVMDPIVPETRESLRALTGVAVKKLLDAPTRDSEQGLAAELISMAPGTEYSGLEPSSGSGQVLMVIAGAAECNGRRLFPRAGVAITPEEPPIRINASDDGAQVLMLQYPRRRPEGL
jgi:hypothetical protein